MAEEKLNLMQKLAKIRKIADVVVKSLKGYNYTYSDINDILANVKAGMAKYGVSLIPLITPQTTLVDQTVIVNTKVDKTGKPYDQSSTEYLVKSDMVFKWVDDETSDCLEVPWALIGSQADPSQAFGSAITYCTRYFLTDYFQIPQVKSDVDEYRKKQKEAEESEDRAVAEALISEFDVTIRAFLAANPDKEEEIKAFLSRYAKNSNYKSIKDPRLATQLTEDFAKAYLGETEAKTKAKSKTKSDETEE